MLLLSCDVTCSFCWRGVAFIPRLPIYIPKTGTRFSCLMASKGVGQTTGFKICCWTTHGLPWFRRQGHQRGVSILGPSYIHVYVVAFLLVSLAHHPKRVPSKRTPPNGVARAAVV